VAFGSIKEEEDILAGIKLFSVRDSLVSDIPAGDKKIANLFFTV
jgi:hypothetical protein